MNGAQSWYVPPELRRLVLYAEDEKLCRRWGELVTAWRIAFPRLNILQEVNRAYSWELSQPAEKRKKQRARFLQAWLARTNERKAIKSQLSPQHAKLNVESKDTCQLCQGTGMVKSTQMVKVTRWGREVEEEREGMVPCTNHV